MKLRAGFSLVALLGLAAACDAGDAQEAARDKARDVQDKAKVKAQEMGAKAADKAEEVGAKARDKAGELVDDATDRAGEMWAERKGELSAGAKSMLAEGAGASGESVLALVHRGEQLAPVAFDIAKTLKSNMDSDVDIEPIVQDLDDEAAQAELDQRIADMPRVETIDGLDVGFKDVSQWDSGGREKESAYLILWRKDDRLYGLVYRSRSRVNIDKIVAEAPRMIAAVQGAL